MSKNQTNKRAKRKKPVVKIIVYGEVTRYRRCPQCGCGNIASGTCDRCGYKSQ